MAQKLGERLILVHAVDLPKLGGSHDEALNWLLNNRREDLAETLTMLRKSGVNAIERVVAGQPEDVLVETSRVESPRLLVVASIGHPGISRHLLGSVSERSAQYATCPTLVVRNARWLEEWAKGNRILKVFVCFNFTETSEAALAWVKELTKIGACEIVVGYSDWPPEEKSRLGNAGALSFAQNLPEVQAILERDLKERVNFLLDGMPCRIRVESSWGRPDSSLVEMAKSEGAELIVVGSHQRHGLAKLWHSSVSCGVLQEAEANVLVIPRVAGLSHRPALAPAWRRALVAIDFSELSQTAITHAFSALGQGGEILFFHATATGETADTSLEQIRQKLHSLVPVDAAKRGVSVQCEAVLSTDVPGAIGQAAERFGADVVCLCTHGRSGLSQALMGSVAREVMHRTKRPLLLVRPQPE